MYNIYLLIKWKYNKKQTCKEKEKLHYQESKLQTRTVKETFVLVIIIHQIIVLEQLSHLQPRCRKLYICVTWTKKINSLINSLTSVLKLVMFAVSLIWLGHRWQTLGWKWRWTRAGLPSGEALPSSICREFSISGQGGISTDRRVISHRPQFRRLCFRCWSHPAGVYVTGACGSVCRTTDSLPAEQEEWGRLHTWTTVACEECEEKRCHTRRE